MLFENSKYILLACSLAIVLYPVESIRLCGAELPEMLSKICIHGYNNKMKRSEITSDRDIIPDYNSLDTENSFGFYPNVDYESQPLLRAMLGESARQQLLSTRRRRFGIIEECCIKPCTRQELSDYCAKPQ